MHLSIVIPALNEATALPVLLLHLRHQQGIELEIIVVDGGSSDGTREVAERYGAQLHSSPRGRGQQMNAGAAQAGGEFLLFLHADSQIESPRLLADALTALRQAIEQRGHHRIAGHFPLRFINRPADASDFYRHIEGKTRLNRPYTINGDQGLLIHSTYFKQLGGFDQRLPFLEDQRISAKIFASGQWLVLPGELLTSARRFEREGHRARYTLMAILMGLHAANVEEFFSQVPAVYAAHDETRPLQLQPMLQLIRQIFRRRGLLQTLGILYRIGRFVRENAWQIAYWRDQRHDDAHLPRLQFFDRWLRPLTHNPVADALATLLVSGWFFLWLPLQLRLLK